MNNIRITKEFHVEMAHALTGYDGPCANIHGHSYLFSVTVIGKPCIKMGDPKLGMVFDYNELGQLIKQLIIQPYDHSLLLHRETCDESIKKSLANQRIKLLEFQPTCENLLINFAGQINSKLPKNVRLHHLKLQETSTSYAEWYYDDNNQQ